MYMCKYVGMDGWMDGKLEVDELQMRRTSTQPGEEEEDCQAV